MLLGLSEDGLTSIIFQINGFTAIRFHLDETKFDALKCIELEIDRALAKMD